LQLYGAQESGRRDLEIHSDFAALHLALSG